MTLLLVCANPGLLLHDPAGKRVAFASFWRVDWSVRGAGRALVVWRGGEVRVLGTDVGLATWLAQDFTRHFPEVRGLPWGEPVVERADVAYDLELGTGLTASAAGVTLNLAEPLDHRRAHTDGFDLAGVPHELSLVYAPCARGTLSIAGERAPGLPKVRRGERPVSSAFLADAEAWSGPGTAGSGV